MLRLLLAAIIMHSCATESAPTGGKEDITPPKVRRMEPQNGTTQFTAKTIDIYFDEYLQSTAFAQVLTSPPMDPKPEIKANGKKVTIQFKAPLQPNTTYSVLFGDEIKDLNAGNVLSNFSYVFSTGEFIDSGEIKGIVKNAEDDKPAEGVWVMLYRPEKPFPVIDEKPIYFAKTNANGQYEIRNVKPGAYDVFALKDQNLNYQYDQTGEMIGFTEYLVEIKDSSYTNSDLRIFFEAGKNIKRQSVKSISPGKALLVYNTAIDTFKVTSQQRDFSYQIRKNTGKDSITIWYSTYYAEKDTWNINIGNEQFDTLTLEWKFIAKDSATKLGQNLLFIENQQVKGNTIKDISEKVYPQSLFKPLKINATRPIIGLSPTKSVQISEDSVPLSIQPNVSIGSEDKSQLQIDFPKKENTTYKIVIPDSFCIDIFGLPNPATSLLFKTDKSDQYGTINLSVSIPQDSSEYLIRLIHERDGLITEWSAADVDAWQKKLTNIPIGSYTISAIKDDNRNKRWDAGVLQKRQQPERVILFPDTYVLKAGWVLDLKIELP